jgi:protein-L-isoaspartate(D-aspartate) O-methyltransferase
LAERMQALRRRMVERQLAARDIADPRVLAAMAKVPRELFVPTGLHERAYDDGPLPIGEGQTISQPYIVALMAQAAEIGPGDRVLDVGTGSGYAAAVLAELAREVCTIERLPRLAEAARERLAPWPNVLVLCGDGSAGVPEGAPYNAILVAAGAPVLPAALRDQLAPGGRLVIPVGEPGIGQRLMRLRRGRDDDEDVEEDLGPVAFVPLIGVEGWPER